ncbi:MAG: NAD-dependent epimerase/dehydratase family protein [Bacteroidota bacterium]
MRHSKKVFVSGADGMLGSHVVRELLKQGYSVKAMVQPGREPQTILGLPKVEIVYLDLLDKEGLNTHMEDCHSCIHVAAYARTNPARGAIFYTVNVEGTRNIALAALKAGLKRFVYVSSSNSLGFTEDKEKGGDEETAWKGDMGLDYVRSKRIAHETVLKLFREQGLPAVLICPTFMIGQYDSGPSSGQLLVQHANNPFKFYTNGGKNFTAAKDVATAIVNAIRLGKNGEAYICGQKNLEFKEFLDLLSKVAKRPAPFLKAPAFLSILAARLMSFVAKIRKKLPLLTPEIVRNANAKIYFDSSKAIRELKMPQSNLEQTIREAYAWFEKYGYLTQTRYEISRQSRRHNWFQPWNWFHNRQKLASNGSKIGIERA